MTHSLRYLHRSRPCINLILASRRYSPSVQSETLALFIGDADDVYVGIYTSQRFYSDHDQG